MKELNLTNNSKLFAQVVNINPGELPSDLFVVPESDIFGVKFCDFGLEHVNSTFIKSVIQKLYALNSAGTFLFIGTGDDEVDKVLLPEIIQNLDFEGCIIANINEKTYKHVVPYVAKGGHYAVLKTPIDINLAKELNILSKELGLSDEKIIMNTDIGGLGYGYEYGFSIIEKVRLEAQKDKYLNYPIFSDASSEALRTKEAKSDSFSSSWGELSSRARMIELSACAGMLAAGANIITVNYPENISLLKGLV